MKHKNDAIHNGNVCPHCGELDTEVTLDYTHCDTEVEIDMECQECDKTWRKVYKLREIKNVE